ncbi:hypothetical protein V1525DRAFT_403619 [Lipomyces kononenkoae]|uniref:Uncharacterized protein n=1 Tax=Lipomyces kononenkoae TaxID=34357 RepID=A0ACC3T3F9_LIPKO
MLTTMEYHPSGLERLPYEIHLKILRYATDSINNPQHRFETTWSLVCRQWRDIIQQQIFENVTLHVGLQPRTTVDHVKLSLELFRARPGLGQYVHNLKLRFDESLLMSNDNDKQTVLDCIATFFEIVAIVVNDGGGCPEVGIVSEFVGDYYYKVDYDWLLSEPAMYTLDLSQSLRSWPQMGGIKTLAFCSTVGSQWVFPPETILSLLAKFPDVSTLSYSFLFLSMASKTSHYFYPKVLEVIKLIPNTITTLELDLRTRHRDCEDPTGFMPYETAPYRGGTGDRLCRFIRERSYNLKKLTFKGPVSLELFEDQRLKPEYQHCYDAEEDDETSEVAAAIKEPYWPNMEHYVIEFENYDSFGEPYFRPTSSSRYGSYGYEQSMFSLPQSAYKRTAEMEAACVTKLNLTFLAASVAMTRMPKIRHFEVSSQNICPLPPAEVGPTLRAVYAELVHTKLVFRRNSAAQADVELDTDDRMQGKPAKQSIQYSLYFRHNFRASPQIYAVWRKKFGSDLVMSDGLDYDY